MLWHMIINRDLITSKYKNKLLDHPVRGDLDIGHHLEIDTTKYLTVVGSPGIVELGYSQYEMIKSNFRRRFL